MKKQGIKVSVKVMDKPKKKNQQQETRLLVDGACVTVPTSDTVNVGIEKED